MSSKKGPLSLGITHPMITFKLTPYKSRTTNVAVSSLNHPSFVHRVSINCLAVAYNGIYCIGMVSIFIDDLW